MSEGSGEKVGPLDLRSEELIAETQKLIRRWSGLQGYGRTLHEHAKYVEFLSEKRRDYHPFAVLQFDDAFDYCQQFCRMHRCSENFRTLTRSFAIFPKVGKS